MEFNFKQLSLLFFTLTMILDQIKTATAGSPISEHAIRHSNAAFPPQLHDYVMAEIAAGNRDELNVRFGFDIATYAENNEKDIRRKIEVQGQAPRRLFATPPPVSSPTAAPFTYVRPPTPDSSLVFGPSSDPYIVIDFEQPITQKDANEWCKNWGKLRTHPQPVWTRSRVAWVDKVIPDSDPTFLTQAEQITKMKETCQTLGRDCWIGLYYIPSQAHFKWRGSPGGQFLTDSNSPWVDPPINDIVSVTDWSGDTPGQTIASENGQSDLCVFLDATENYEWSVTDCTPGPDSSIRVALCQNPYYDPNA